MITLQNAVVAILALVILPSLTSLSAGWVAFWTQAIPGIAPYLGPLNPVKLGLPILIFYAWLKRQEIRALFPPWFWPFLGVLFATGSFGLWYGWSTCLWPPVHPNIYREWAVTWVGLLGALCWFVLPQKSRVHVLGGWIAILGVGIALDLVFPSIPTWLYSHVFDPETRQRDLIEVGRPVLTGIWGRQSLAKLLAWTGWLGWVALALKTAPKKSGKDFKRAWIFVIAFGCICHGLILATSQRGPFVGALVGWGALAFLLVPRLGFKKVATVGGATVIALGILTWLFVPSEVMNARIAPFFHLLMGSKTGLDTYQQHAIGNAGFRWKMAAFSWDWAVHHPWGTSCLHMTYFLDAGIFHVSHAHNMIIQQFREKGFPYGIAHLLLWVLACVGAYRAIAQSKLRETPFAAYAAFAGIITTLGLGMFDHPWFTLNHSLMMWIFLCYGFSGFKKSPR